MKTFDEAIQSVLIDDDMLIANLLSCRAEHMKNPEFNEMIKDHSAILMVEVAKEYASGSDPVAVMATVCSSLHMAFCIGLNIGIEMEKP